MWLSLGHFKTSSWHTHTHVYTYFSHRILSTSVNLCVFFFPVSPSLSLFLSLSLSLCSFFLPLFSVQLVNPSSVYQTTSFDTHSKSLSVSSSTDRMRPSVPQSYVGVREHMQVWVALLHECAGSRSLKFEFGGRAWGRVPVSIAKSSRWN